MARLIQIIGLELGIAAVTAVLSVEPALADSTQDNDASGISEIIVTAEKHEEKLSQTPLSITAISSKTLQDLDATQFRDFANTVPGLSFTTIGVGQNQITLRGVTTGLDVAPTVGIYIDDVPYGSSTSLALASQLGLDVGLFDIDRIEVLRGPQGTLYGASTMGGLIKYVTPLPDTTTLSGSTRAGVSTTHDGGTSYYAAADINLPIASDKAGLRLSGFYSHDGGYIDDPSLGLKDVNRSKVYGGRADFLLLPVENLSIRLTGMTQDISRDGSAVADYTLSGQPIGGNLDQSRALPEPFTERFRLISATVRYDFGPAALTSISSYQSARSEAFYDYSVLYAPLVGAAAAGLYNDTQVNKTTQELRLAGTGTHLDWLIGGYFTHESSGLFEGLPVYDDTGALIPINLLTVALPTTYREYAGFATLTYHVTSQLDLTGGVRSGHNSQTVEQIGSGLLIGSLPVQNSSDSSTTYLADLRFRATDNLMAYARLATGYRPGGPNVVAKDANGDPVAPPTFNPDTLRSYEVGIKASTADRRFSVDGDIYQINWNNLQVSTTVNGVGILANAAAAKIKGGELTLTAVPVSQLTLVAAVGIIDAKMDKDAPAIPALQGEPLPNTPRFTGTISGDYSFPLFAIHGFAGATVRHVSDRLSSFDVSPNRPQYHLPEYTTTDLRTGVEFAKARIQLYVRNVFDSRGQLSANSTFAIVPDGPVEVSILQPRTIGLSVTTRF